MESFWEDFAAAFTALMVTELGDSTFVLAAVMAASESRTAVFLGNMTAMVIMTGISVLLGKSIFSLLNAQWVFLCGYICFCAFAFWSFYSAHKSNDNDQSSSDEELQEALLRSPRRSFLSTLWRSLGVTMLAEWGDRSQLSTMTVAGQRETVAVVAGSLAGLAVMTALSVLGGRWVAGCLDKKSILVASGVLFLAFAIDTLITLKTLVLQTHQ